MKPSPRPAFTLVELLVVVAIVAVLVAMFLPALARSRDAAQSVVCQSNLKQQFVAVQMYSDANKGYGPCEMGTNYATDPDAVSANAWSNGGSGARWMRKLLPYMNSNSAAASTTCFSYESNAPDRLVRAFLCPTTATMSTSGSGRSYGMNRAFSIDFTGSDAIAPGAANANAAPMNLLRNNTANYLPQLWLLVDSYLYNNGGLTHWSNSVNPGAGTLYRSHQARLNFVMGDGRVINAARTNSITFYTVVRNNGVWVTELW